MFKNILKNFWEYNPEKDAEKISEELVKFVLNSAFDVFRDRGFRKNFNFREMTQVQRDKVYNELSISALCFTMFLIDDLAEVRAEEIYFWRQVKEKIPVIFRKWLKKLKIEEKSINYWQKLLDKRYEDYRLCQRDYRLKLESVDKSFSKSKNDILKNDFIRFEALSFGFMYHIRKGKMKNNDPISKYLKTWLAILNKQIIKKVL